MKLSKSHNKRPNPAQQTYSNPKGNKRYKPDKVQILLQQIPEEYHKYTWLYKDCNKLTKSGRKRIIDLLFGRLSNARKLNRNIIDIPLHTTSNKHTIRTTMFRFRLNEKRWNQVVISKCASS